MINVNSIYTTTEGSAFRVLWLSIEADAAFVIDLTDNKLPFRVRLSGLESQIQDGEALIRDDDPYFSLTLKDKDCLQDTKQVVANLLKAPGRPCWITLYTVAKHMSLGNNVYQYIDKLPETKKYLNSIIETREEWRKRKITWAIIELLKEGAPLTYTHIRVKSSISSETFDHEYMESEIEKLTDDKCV